MAFRDGSETSTAVSQGPVDALMDLVSGTLERLVIVERNAAELTHALGSGKSSDADPFKRAIVEAGLVKHVDDLEEELQNSDEYEEARGLRVAVRGSKLASGKAVALVDEVRGEFPLVGHEVVTGKIDYITLSPGGGTYGTLELRDAATFPPLPDKEDPCASIEPLFELTSAGLLVPVVELIQLP